jgi:hypothetical protein
MSLIASSPEIRQLINEKIRKAVLADLAGWDDEKKAKTNAAKSAGQRDMLPEKRAVVTSRMLETREINGNSGGWSPYRPHKLPSGDTLNLQGYEPQVADIYATRGFTVSPRPAGMLISYKNPLYPRKTRYLPDLLISKRGTKKAILEVKSTFTLAHPKYIDENVGKFQAATKYAQSLSADFIVALFDRGRLTTVVNPTTSREILSILSAEHQAKARKWLRLSKTAKLEILGRTE